MARKLKIVMKEIQIKNKINKMKKQILILSALVVGMTVFGQKSELKSAEKAIKVGDFTSAMTAINQAEGLIANADQKTKAKFYYLRGKALYKNGANKNIEEVGNALNELISYETETKKLKYSKEFGEIINKLVIANQTAANTNYEKALQTKASEDYETAAKGYYNVYLLSPIDTTFLDNAALLYNIGKNHSTSIKLYNELLSKNYTGIATIYSATNKADGKKLTFADKKSRNVQIKLGIVENPKDELKKTRRPLIFKNLATGYIALDNTDKALEVIAQGREEFPNNYVLIIEEANLYFRSGNEVKFKELLEKAIELNPTEPALYYNVGVMSMNQKNIEEAISNFKKAIELKPDYGDAYNNIGAAILSKTETIIEEMNKNLSDFNKYDKLQAKQFDVYREALPYYESAFKYDNQNIGVVQTLMGIYENLEMTDKLKEIRPVYEELKQ